MEQVICTLTESLIARGHEVLLILSERSEHAQWERELPSKVLQATRKHKRWGRKRHDIALLSQALNQLPVPGIIVALSTTSVYVCRKALTTSRIQAAVVSWLHFSLHHLGGVRYLNYADGHLAISSGMDNQLGKQLPGSSRKLVFNPIKLADCRMERTLDGFDFLYMGRLSNETKRVDMLLRSIAKVNGDWRLHLVGDGQDRELLKKVAVELGIEGRLIWYGWKTNPWTCLTACSALVMTSIVEGFPLVLIEALSRGIPVLSSRCETGPDDIVIDTMNGWLFESNNEQQLTLLLQGIVTGTTRLPEADACIQSVAKYQHERVAARYEQALAEWCSARTSNHAAAVGAQPTRVQAKG